MFYSTDICCTFIHHSHSNHLVFDDVDQSLCTSEKKIQGSHEGAAQNRYQGSKNMCILRMPIKL